jgi:AcrR family transcriptional regulator
MRCETASVPQTRHEIERDLKVREILSAAETRLREGGYESLSIAGIARELGLAPNSIYWYFPSKDDLFVAAVRHMLEGMVARKPPSRRTLERRVLWFVEQLDDLDHLRIALYERSRRATVIAQFVEELKASSRQMVANALRGEVADEELGIAAEALLATIEGARLLGLGSKDRNRVVAYALSRFTTSGQRPV